MHGYSEFSSWIPRALAKFCFLRSFKPRKKLPVLVGTTNRKPRVSRDAQNACAVTKVSTVLKLNYGKIDLLQQLIHKSRLSSTVNPSLAQNIASHKENSGCGSVIGLQQRKKLNNTERQQHKAKNAFLLKYSLLSKPRAICTHLYTIYQLYKTFKKMVSSHEGVRLLILTTRY